MRWPQELLKKVSRRVTVRLRRGPGESANDLRYDRHPRKRRPRSWRIDCARNGKSIGDRVSRSAHQHWHIQKRTDYDSASVLLAVVECDARTLSAGSTDMEFWYKQLVYVDSARGILGGLLLTYEAPRDRRESGRRVRVTRSIRFLTWPRIAHASMGGASPSR